MVRIERKPLAGNVEVDETLVGGVEHGGKRGRGADKCIVVIAVEIKNTKGFGRERMPGFIVALAATYPENGPLTTLLPNGTKLSP